MIGGDPTIPQLEKRIRRLLRHAVVAELHQQVARAIDDVTGGIGQSVLDVVVGKVKVAAQAEFRRIADELLQMGDESLQILAIIVIAVVGMRRGDHVSDAVRRRRAAHGDRDVPRFRAVIYFRKDVRMNVDHDCRNTSTPLRVALPSNLNRFAGKDQERERSALGEFGPRSTRASSLSAAVLGRAKNLAQTPSLRYFEDSSCHQIVGTALDLRISRSAVTSVSPCTSGSGTDDSVCRILGITGRKG